MIPWAAKQKFKYTLLFTFLLIAVFSVPAYLIISDLLYQPPSCTDGIQNQDETGIDCGGVCPIACMDRVRDLTVVWSRVFPVDEGVYDLAALVENPNKNAGIKEMSYSFRVLDEIGKTIYERKGTTYVNPLDSFIVFEPNVRIPTNIHPKSVVFTIDARQEWLETDEVSDVPIIVKDRSFENITERPRVDVRLLNTDELRSFDNVDVVALVTDQVGNVVAAASTYIDHIEPGGEVPAVFTWNLPFSNLRKVSCDDPNASVEYMNPADVMLVFDRSGSMNDDNPDPPQPLTDAKRAAKLFIDKMQPIDRVGLVSFATEASDPIDQTLTLDHDAVRAAVDHITIGVPDNEQHTNLGAGIREAARELNSVRHNEKARRAMVVLTDGIASRPLNPEDPSDNEKYPERYAAAQALGAQKDGISIYVIALGEKRNKDFLEQRIASRSSNYYFAASSKELKGIYSDIARAVCEDRTLTLKVYVRRDMFYASPSDRAATAESN